MYSREITLFIGIGANKNATSPEGTGANLSKLYGLTYERTTQMSRFMKPLTSNVQLYTAQLERSPIVIFIADELVGSGIIEDITDASVKVPDEYFMRAACMFKYAS